jgi:hypothetical protein
MSASPPEAPPRLTNRGSGTHIGRMGRVVATALLAAVCACGSPGDEPRAGWTSYTSVAGAYRIPYQAPPWRLSRAGATSVELRVPSNAERIEPDAAVIIDPKYRLLADVTGGDAASLADREAADVRARGDLLLAGPRPVTTEPGASGFEVLSVDALIRYHRVVFLDRPAGGTVSLRFDANPNLDEPQVDAMVAGVEVIVEP